MIEVYEKRGRWCAKSDTKRMRKFLTEIEAREYVGHPEEVEEDTDSFLEPTEAEEWASFNPDA